MPRILVAAGLYNLAWGAAVVLFPLAFFRLAGLPDPVYPSIWQCVGMIVGVYGVGYLVAARDPRRHWPIVLVGLLGKIFGPIGFVLAAARGELPWGFGWTILTNDLVWWLPFAAILWHAARQAQEPTEPAPALPDAIRAAVDQHGRSLAQLAERTPVLVVLLRHSGCTFCKETLADLADRRRSIEAAGHGIAIVHMSAEQDAAGWLGRYGLDDLPRFSDPQRRLYRAFELARGSFRQLFGLRVWLRGIRATLGGHVVGTLDGDGFQLPGAFVLHDGAIRRAFRAADAADRADYAALACEPPA